MNAGTTRFAADQSIAQLIGQTLRGGTIQAADLWGTNPNGYVLDPVAMAAQLGGERYAQAAQEAADWVQQKASTPLDAGSVGIDALMERLGLNTNLSGMRRQPVEYYPLADDAQYKRQFKPGNPGTQVEFINLRDVPMADWDMPGPDHRDANVTVRHLGDVEDLVRNYVRAHPTSQLDLYITPGGFRAWELGEQHSASGFTPRFEQLQVDPDYARLSTNASPLAVAGIPVDQAGFRSRISHKPGRTDWVAQPIAQFAGAEALLIPRSQQLVRTLHDEPIARHYLDQGVSPAAMASLNQQLGSASAALQNELRKRFRI